MWPMLMVFVIVAMAGIYNLPQQRHVENSVADQKAQAIVEEMTIYRDAVRAYYIANPAASNVSVQTLIATGALPAWSTIAQRGTTIFFNCHNGDQVYIFATSAPEVDVNQQLAEISQHSILAGSYRASDQTLVSKVTGPTGISLVDVAAYNPPDGVPVWLTTPN